MCVKEMTSSRVISNVTNKWSRDVIHSILLHYVIIIKTRFVFLLVACTRIGHASMWLSVCACTRSHTPAHTRVYLCLTFVAPSSQTDTIRVIRCCEIIFSVYHLSERADICRLEPDVIYSPVTDVPFPYRTNSMSEPRV